MVDIDVGMLSEAINQKLDIDAMNSNASTGDGLASNANMMLKDHSNDTKPYLKTTYVSGTSGYNIWSNGYCEQWGFISSVTNNALDSATITFPKTFKDTNYFVSLTEMKNNNTGNDPATNGQAVYTKQVNSMHIATYSWTNGRFWKVCGYLASGQY